MGKGRFINQKLGKRVSRKVELLRSELVGRPQAGAAGRAVQRLPKKGNSREVKPSLP